MGVAVHDHQQLPARIASHFDANGAADGWSSKSSFLFLMVTVGIGIPSLLSALLYAVRFLPAKFLNVPNPEYWRKPENYRKACDFLLVSSWWFGSAFLLWQTAFSRMIVAANQVSPPHLDSSRVVLLSVPLLLFSLGWAALIVLRFSKIPEA